MCSHSISYLHSQTSLYSQGGSTHRSFNGHPFSVCLNGKSAWVAGPTTLSLHSLLQPLLGQGFNSAERLVS